MDTFIIRSLIERFSLKHLERECDLFLSLSLSRGELFEPLFSRANRKRASIRVSEWKIIIKDLTVVGAKMETEMPRKKSFSRARGD